MSLEINLPSLFSLQQTGFIQNRHSSNLRIEFSLEYIIPYPHSTQSKAFSAARDIWNNLFLHWETVVSLLSWTTERHFILSHRYTQRHREKVHVAWERACEVFVWSFCLGGSCMHVEKLSGDITDDGSVGASWVRRIYWAQQQACVTHSDLCCHAYLHSHLPNNTVNISGIVLIQKSCFLIFLQHYIFWIWWSLSGFLLHSVSPLTVVPPFPKLCWSLLNIFKNLTQS